MQSAHIDASEVSIEVQNGKVTLEGTVPERRMKHQIEDLDDDCMGVQDIENQVRVARSETGASAGESSTSGASSSGTGTFGTSSSSTRSSGTTKKD